MFGPSYAVLCPRTPMRQSIPKRVCNFYKTRRKAAKHATHAHTHKGRLREQMSYIPISLPLSQHVAIKTLTKIPHKRFDCLRLYRRWGVVTTTVVKSITTCILSPHGNDFVVIAEAKLDY